MKVTEYAKQASEIFLLSDSFVRIKELIDDDSSTIDDISDIILIDPALAGIILKLANSSFFNYPGKIDTITKAVLVLGITEVYNLVIAYFTTKAFKSASKSSEFLDEFWLQSVDCALLIKFFGTSQHVMNAERLFILGLLHNLGELVVHQVSPEKINECKEAEKLLSPQDAQKKVLGFTYSECSAELLKQWQLPYSLIGPIRNQAQEDLSQYNIETQLLSIAQQVMSIHHSTQPSNYSHLIRDHQLSDLNIDEPLLMSAIDFCDIERLDILSLLNPSSTVIF